MVPVLREILCLYHFQKPRYSVNRPVFLFRSPSSFLLLGKINTKEQAIRDDNSLVLSSLVSVARKSLATMFTGPGGQYNGHNDHGEP